jgi:hypothetical protein
LEASNSAISAHIAALSERLVRLERSQFDGVMPNGRSKPAMPVPRAPDDEVLEGEHRETLEKRQGREDAEGRRDVDPDGLQRAYAEFIATTQNSLNCVGVHTWSLCTATRVNSGCVSSCAACLALVPSVFVLLLQCFLLQAISLESLHPSCTLDADCGAGMWCAPSRDYSGVRRDPGMCDDCRWASKLESQEYESLPSRYNADAYAAVSDTLSEAVAYCETADTEPDRCDYLVSFHKELTLAPLAVFVCTTGIVLTSLVADMDRQAQIADVLEHRVANMAASPRLCVIASMARLIFVLRMLILPGVVVYAYAALVLASPRAYGLPLPVSFIVHGLVVSFIHNVDGALALAFLDEGARTLIREAFADKMAHDDERERSESTDQSVLQRMESTDQRQLQSGFRRFLALCFGVLIMMSVLSTESLMDSSPLFRLDWDELPAKFVENPAMRVCTNVATTLGATTMLATTFYTLVWSITYQIFNSFKCCGVLDVVFAPVVALVTMPALSFCLLKFGYTSFS